MYNVVKYVIVYTNRIILHFKTSKYNTSSTTVQQYIFFSIFCGVQVPVTEYMTNKKDKISVEDLWFVFVYIRLLQCVIID